MLVLALESSTALASVALVRDGQTLKQGSSPNPKGHSEFMNLAIENCLKSENLSLNDIDLFAVGVGPGSFTGIRVALNIAKTFSKLLDKPVFTADSLSILQAQAKQSCLCMINAYKNMVYYSVYNDAGLLSGPAALPVKSLEELLVSLNIDLRLEKHLLFVGDGYKFYDSMFSSKLKNLSRRDLSICDFPQASTLGKMACKNNAKTSDWKSLFPLYIRASEAEENLQKRT